MRTTKIKVGTEKKDAVLVAGGSGFKVYTASAFDGWILVLGRKVVPVGDQSPEFKTVSKYVNLKYQPLAEQDSIKKSFERLLDHLKAPHHPDAEPSL